MTSRNVAFRLWTFGSLSLALIVASGCNEGSPSTTGTTITTPPPPAAAKTVYFVNAEPPQVTGGISITSILAYSATTGGTATPFVTINAPSNVVFDSVATDSTGQLYVAATTYSGSGSTATSTGYEILVYAAGVTSTATPVRTITSTAAFFPSTMVVDSTGNLYVGLRYSAGPPLGEVVEYSSTATGAAVPIRSIQSSGSPIWLPFQIALDSSNNLYMAGSVGSIGNYAPGILVFSSTASGEAVASSQITETDAFGVAIDSSGHIFTPIVNTTTSGVDIVEFAAGATGKPTPLKTFSGSGLSNLSYLTLDAAGNIFAVAQLAPNIFIARFVVANQTVGPGNLIQLPSSTSGSGGVAVY